MRETREGEIKDFPPFSLVDKFKVWVDVGENNHHLNVETIVVVVECEKEKNPKKWRPSKVKEGNKT